MILLLDSAATSGGKKFRQPHDVGLPKPKGTFETIKLRMVAHTT
jgi:hypothetical protein